MAVSESSPAISRAVNSRAGRVVSCIHRTALTTKARWYIAVNPKVEICNRLASRVSPDGHNSHGCRLLKICFCQAQFGESRYKVVDLVFFSG
jgi:hypothetical protein